MSPPKVTRREALIKAGFDPETAVDAVGAKAAIVKPEHVAVGVPGTAMHCAGACALKAALKADFVWVSASRVWVGWKGNKKLGLPNLLERYSHRSRIPYNFDNGKPGLTVDQPFNLLPPRKGQELGAKHRRKMGDGSRGPNRAPMLSYTGYIRKDAK